MRDALVSIDGLTQYFGGLCAVAEFSAQVEHRELRGLIGPNGAGKTTIFNLMSGFYTPSRGTIRFDGKPIRGKAPHQVTSMGVARTFQNIRLWHDMNVLDNIRVSQHFHMGYSAFEACTHFFRFGRREREITANAFEILEALGLKDAAFELPRNLPYGVRRRVEIARALSIKPKLLMLDEPAAGLNTSDVGGLIDLIRWIHKEFDITIWMIEHQMQVVMTLCEHIQVIDFGAVIAEGGPEDIKNNPEVIKAYLGDDAI